MIRDIAQFSEKRYDLLIVGGGINGAAMAHLAALKGKRVALLEKQDFASGTSSKSTKLVHGGLRYLENFEFAMVSQALKERYLQLKESPHLVKSLGFIIPIYQSGSRPFWKVKLGVFLYDWLCGKYSIGSSRPLTIKEVQHFLPGVKTEGLKGGVIYYDAQMDDARLCLDNVLRASELGADVANYVEVKTVDTKEQEMFYVRAVDQLTGKEFDVKAKKVVFTAGPWTDVLRRREDATCVQKIRTTKGVHLILEDQISKHAMFLSSEKDSRMFFVVPYRGQTLVGTTDTDYSGNPDDIQVEEQDLEYLFNEVRTAFPSLNILRKNIVGSFAGLRPLVFNKDHSPSRTSREHMFLESSSGLYYLIGGKYTTYRKIANDCLNRIFNNAFGEITDDFHLYASQLNKIQIAELSREYKLEKVIVRQLENTYGHRMRAVLDLVRENSSLGERICSCCDVIKAQIRFAKQEEMAQKKEDILSRRLSLSS
ncbi:Glycerol-3-phosphate dehydrogenase, partial [hydrothermal vent metagenome]